eukprot:scaffold102418_cov63-Phaeocystis_antarctica.AAC.3
MELSKYVIELAERPRAAGPPACAHDTCDRDLLLRKERGPCLSRDASGVAVAHGLLDHAGT